MAMFALLILTSLAIAFLTLGTSEPLISSNHARTAQARAMAEAGLERAIWALTNPTLTGGITAPAAGVVGGAPYNGASGSFLGVSSIGGFVVTITGVSTSEVSVESVGWVPTNSAADTRTKSHRKVTATLNQIRFAGTPPPAPLAIRGTINGNGNVSVTSENDQASCGHLPGAYSTGTQNLTNNGSADIQGNPGQRPNVATATFDQYTLNNSDLDAMKAVAQAAGTYFQGNRTFDSGTPLPSNGFIFVDTTSGVNPPCTSPCVPGTDIPVVTIGTNAGPGGTGTFSGMIIVNGRLILSGVTTLNAMVYAQDNVTITGGVRINGALMSRNIINPQPANTFNTTNPTLPYINWNCANAKGAGLTPKAWFIKTGTYREPSG